MTPLKPLKFKNINVLHLYTNILSPKIDKIQFMVKKTNKSEFKPDASSVLWSEIEVEG